LAASIGVSDRSFPRSIDRGPIEAFDGEVHPKRSAHFRDQLIAAPLKREGLYHFLCSNIDFRDQLIAAPLKPLTRLLLPFLTINFRDQLIAAPLKREGLYHFLCSNIDFRDQLIAAPLKRRRMATIMVSRPAISAIN